MSVPAGDPSLPPPDPRGPLLRALFEALADPVLVTDPRSRVLFENRRARELFTVEQDADGERRHRVEVNNFLFTSFLARARSSAADSRELVLVEPGTGEERVFEVAPSALDGDAGLPPDATVSLLRDVTTLRRTSNLLGRESRENARLAAELAKANRGLEAAVEAATAELRERNRRLAEQSAELTRAYRHKSEFLASMSHELRTPINALLGYTALLRERIYGELNQRQEDALTRMETASDHLLELVNDVLDLARIEAGRMPLHLEGVPLEPLVRQLAHSVEPLARARGLELVVDVPADLPPLVSDATRLRQIVLNLLSNAVKFTREGTVSVVARRVGDDAVEVAVADTGIGIPPDYLATIFDDFRQVDQSSTREFDGTGLGLSIVRKLLGLLGGSIRVESSPGEGSVFTATLPLRSPEVPQGEASIRRALQGEAVILRDGTPVPLPPLDPSL